MRYDSKILQPNGVLKMKKIMILGASKGQVPFINICKEKGYYVICVSIKGDYPGFKIADKCYYIDTRDEEQILNIARAEQIDAITSDQTDVCTSTIAYVSEKMGLKSIGYDKALLFSNKYQMRNKAQELGFAVPAFFNARSLNEALKKLPSINFPAIIKPVDSSGSRGVRKILNVSDLRQYFSESQSNSKSGEVIVEEFIEGREYLADGLVIDGKFINTDLGIKEYFPNEGMYISKMCMFTSAIAIDNAIEMDVLKTNKGIVEGFGLPFGITHAEYIVSDKDKRVYLVEIAARGGGVYLSSHLTPAATGINTNKILIEYLTENKAICVDDLRPDNKTSAWICFALNHGRIVSIEGKEELKNIHGVFLSDLDDLYIGKEVDDLTDDTNKMGPILIMANSRAECFDIVNRVKKTLKIRTQNNGGIIEDMIW